MAHKHADLMKILAQQILDGVDNIGEHWECRLTEDSEWHDVKKTLIPGFNPIYEYRLKQKFIMINGYDVPEPQRVAPNRGEVYFTHWPFTKEGYRELAWVGDEQDLQALENGTVHLNKDAAIIHGKAIYSFTKVQS